MLTINPRDPRPAWQQVTATLTEAIRSGVLAPGDELSSITEVSTLQGIGTGVTRHALDTLAADGLIIVQHGRAVVVAGEPGGFDLRNAAARLGHSGGGATTLRHYADPVPEVDRRAAAYLAQLTARSTPSSPPP